MSVTSMSRVPGATIRRQFRDVVCSVHIFICQCRDVFSSEKSSTHSAASRANDVSNLSAAQELHTSHAYAPSREAFCSSLRQPPGSGHLTPVLLAMTTRHHLGIFGGRSRIIFIAASTVGAPVLARADTVFESLVGSPVPCFDNAISCDLRFDADQSVPVEMVWTQPLKGESVHRGRLPMTM